MTDINQAAISGNLTRDPELRSTPSGSSVCSLRVACNGRRKVNDEWVDKPNYFDVTVWGKQGENIAQHLSKGSAVFVAGRLDWREWEHEGNKRQAVQIVADTVRYGSKKDNGSDQHSAPKADDSIPF